MKNLNNVLIISSYICAATLRRNCNTQENSATCPKVRNTTPQNQEESQVASEIKELEERIKNAVIIEKSGTHKVSIGNTVTVEYLGELEEDEERVMQFQLVGETEADFAKGKLSNESPLGKAVVGKKTGEIVRFSTAQGGVEEYKVLNIK